MNQLFASGAQSIGVSALVSVLPKMPGQALVGTGYLSHAGLLQAGPIGYVALTYGHGFPLVG